MINELIQINNGDRDFHTCNDNSAINNLNQDTEVPRDNSTPNARALANCVSKMTLDYSNTSSRSSKVVKGLER